MPSDSDVLPDVLVKAIAPDVDLRIAAVVTTELVREAASRHKLSAPAADALGRALTSGLLLATMTKGDERVTVQLIGDGPLGSLTVDANAEGDVRGYVRHPQANGSLGTHGSVNVTRDLGLRELYQGQVAMTSGSIDEDLESYLHVSEQVPSAMVCDVVLDDEGRVVRAAGILVQALPGGEPETVSGIKVHLHSGAMQSLLAAGDVSPKVLAERLLPSLKIEFLSDRPVRFKCKCSRERIRDTLHLLSVTELDEMIEEGKDAEITCNFCNSVYKVDTAGLVEIRAEVAGPREPN